MKLREEIEKILGDFVMDKIGLADGCWLDVTDVVVDKARSWALEQIGKDEEERSYDWYSERYPRQPEVWSRLINFVDGYNTAKQEIREKIEEELEE